MSRNDPAFLFELRFALSRYSWKAKRHIPCRLTIRAFEAPPYDAKGKPTGGRYGHTRIDIEATLTTATGKRKTLFKRGETYVGIPSHASIDGAYAREAVVSAVAMKPGDTDEEYFAGYTRLQRAWASTYGESLDIQKHDRYCDPETGEVRS